MVRGKEQEPAKPGDGGIPGVARAEALVVAAIALLAFLLRMATWGDATPGGEYLFSQVDAYYHLRRVLVFLHSFPSFHPVDLYMAYPFGAECPWPPLYDLFLAGIAASLSPWFPLRAAVENAVTFAPPVLAALTVFPVHRFARKAGGGAAGVIAAALMVAQPYHLQYSVVGSGDHHTAEVFLLALLLAVFPFAARDERTGRKAALLSGLVLGAAVLVWQGAIVFAAILVLSLLVGTLLGNRHGEADRNVGRIRPAARRTLECLAVSAVSVSAVRLLYPSATSQTVFGFGFFSWFQPAALLFGIGAVLFIELGIGRSGTRGRGGIALGAIAVCACLVAPVAVPAWRENVVAGFRFLAADDPWFSTIQEFMPFKWNIFLQGGWDSFLLVSRIYLVTVLLPFAVAAVHCVRRARSGWNAYAAPFLAVALVVGGLALLQMRWANAQAFNIAVGGGVLVASLTVAARPRPRDATAPPPRRTGRVLAAAFVSLLLAVPPTALVVDLLGDVRAYIRFVRYPALTWLRENTPRTAGLWGDGKPEYGVLSQWSYGHLVQYIGERPTVVNNFGTQLRGNGMPDLARFLHAGDESELLSLCDRRGVRFLVLSHPLFELRGMAPLIGVDYEKTYMETYHDPRGYPRRRASARLLALPVVGLYEFDGTSYRGGAAMTRFRLVHESLFTHPISGNPERMKVFEYVRGARLRGRTRPGAEVLVSCRLETDGGRTILYTSRVEADREGVFRLTFPYSTGGKPGTVRVIDRPSASTGPASVAFDVTERDVLDGREVALPTMR